jgi:phosphonate transport system substrate-binding protein
MYGMLRRMLRKILAISLCTTVLAGCSRQEAPSFSKSEPSSENLLRIGLIPEQNIFHQLDRYQPLVGYLSRQVGAKIEPKILPRYGNIIDNFQSEKLDGAFFGSFTYTLAHAKLGVSAIARPLALDNTSTYYGMILVRKDSGIRTIKDMKGKRFAFVDKATTAGYLLPLEYFREHGVNDYKKHLKESYFAGTHQDAIYDVLNKRADIGAAKNTVYYRLAKEDPRISSELMILKRSPDVPENALALRKDIGGSMESKIKETLLGMHNDPKGKEILKRFGAIRFIETTEEDYKAVYDYARHIGLDLPTYDYIND